MYRPINMLRIRHYSLGRAQEAKLRISTTLSGNALPRTLRDNLDLINYYSSDLWVTRTNKPRLYSESE